MPRSTTKLFLCSVVPFRNTLVSDQLVGTALEKNTVNKIVVNPVDLGRAPMYIYTQFKRTLLSLTSFVTTAP